LLPNTKFKVINFISSVSNHIALSGAVVATTTLCRMIGQC